MVNYLIKVYGRILMGRYRQTTRLERIAWGNGGEGEAAGFRLTGKVTLKLVSGMSGYWSMVASQLPSFPAYLD